MPGSRDRPGRADVPDLPDAGRVRSADRPDPSSRAGLKLRLERLPPGHPSSPRVAGDSGAGRVPAADSGPGRDPADGKRQAPDKSAGQDQARDGARDGRGEAPAGRPDAGRDAGRAGRDAGRARGDAGRDGGAGPDGPDPPGGGPDAPKRDYWTEVPRVLRAWAAHVRRWPPERRAAAVDRSRDPAGSWRGDGNQYLSPEQHARAKDVIAGVQRAERALTGTMRQVARDNAGGGWLDGLQFRRKGEERLKEKIADLSDTSAPDATPEEIVREISDAIRYTFCAEPERYTDTYWDIKERLETHGYEMRYSENHWPDTQYKGINTRWITPEGQRFEVQFHTQESFHAKQSVTHVSYERLRNTLTGDYERLELRAFQGEVCSWIAIPEGIADIPNYRKEGN